MGYTAWVDASVEDGCLSRVITNFNADGGLLGVFCGWWWAPRFRRHFSLLMYLLRGLLGLGSGMAHTLDNELDTGTDTRYSTYGK